MTHGTGPLVQVFEGNARFDLGRKLGQGGFGVVFEAFDRDLGAAVALKTLLRLEPGAVHRFKREFRSLANVAHPHLINLYELHSDGDHWFFTMELVDGPRITQYVRGTGYGPDDVDAEPLSVSDEQPTTLNSAVETADLPVADAGGISGTSRLTLTPTHVLPAPPLDLDRLRDAFTQLAEGVSAIHANGILHRDLKPSNVLVGANGRVVILDFGLVKSLDATAVKSHFLEGTPAYMSPEQGTDTDLTEASDWYSVGVMLFECLTGRRPHPGTALEIMNARERYDPPPLRTVVESFPPDLGSLCEDLLRRNPAARPSGAEVISRLRSGHASTGLVRREVETERLVGRKTHLAAFNAAYQSAEEGRTVAVSVCGASGMGKSSLVHTALAELKRRKPKLLEFAGQCYERESVPYKAFDSVVDALAEYLKALPTTEVDRLLPPTRDVLALARLFPVLNEVEAIADDSGRAPAHADSLLLRRRAFKALRDLLSSLSDHRDVVLFVDDAQWGDADSAALLADLLRPPDPPAVLVVLAYRSEDADTSPFVAPLSPTLETFKEDLDLRRIEVGELTRDEARELALSRLGATDPSTAARAEAIARESGGNPLFVDELTMSDDAHTDVDLQAVIRRRVKELSAEAQTLLEVVSLTGQPIGRAVATTAATLDAQEHPALGQLRAGRLVRLSGEVGTLVMEPYHDRIRQAVVTGLSDDRRRHLHLQLATAWAGSGGAEPETLALHFHGAGEDEQAARYGTEAAADADRALAFDRAVRLYRFVVELATSYPDERQQLYKKLGDALTNAGRSFEAAQEYQRALDGASPDDALDLERRAAEELLRAGHVDEGLTVLRSVLERVGLRLTPPGPPAQLSALVRTLQLRLRGHRFKERDPSTLSARTVRRLDACWAAGSSLTMIDNIRSADYQFRFLLLSLRAGDPYRISCGLSLLACSLGAKGGPKSRSRVDQVLRQADELAHRANSVHAQALATACRGIAAKLQGRYQESLFSLQESLVLFKQCTGVSWEVQINQIFLLEDLLWLGEWAKLRRRVDEYLEDAEQRGDLYGATYMRSRVTPFLALAADQPERARTEAEQAIARWDAGAPGNRSESRFHHQHRYEFASQLEARLYAGEPDEALTYYDQSVSNLKASLQLRNVQAVRIETLHIHARIALQRAASDSNPRYLKIASDDARKLDEERTPWSDALAACIRADATALSGTRVEALALYEKAEESCLASGLRLCAVAARRARGHLLDGDQKAAVVAQADAEMTAQGIVSPGRFAAMLSPALWRHPVPDVGQTDPAPS